MSRYRLNTTAPLAFAAFSLAYCASLSPSWAGPTAVPNNPAAEASAASPPAERKESGSSDDVLEGVAEEIDANLGMITIAWKGIYGSPRFRTLETNLRSPSIKGLLRGTPIRVELQPNTDFVKSITPIKPGDPSSMHASQDPALAPQVSAIDSKLNAKLESWQESQFEMAKGILERAKAREKENMVFFNMEINPTLEALNERNRILVINNRMRSRAGKTALIQQNIEKLDQNLLYIFAIYDRMHTYVVTEYEKDWLRPDMEEAINVMRRRAENDPLSAMDDLKSFYIRFSNLPKMRGAARR